MRMLGIILAGGNNYRMKELSNKRAAAAMPVAGSYRAIDFALSNMSNSGIQKVAVLTQYNSHSLHEHLHSAKWWRFGRKQGGLYLKTPTITADSSSWYRGSADALAQNLEFLKRSHEPYVVICSGTGIYNLDYNKVLDYHMEKRSDLTVVCSRLPKGEDISQYHPIQLDGNDRVIAVGNEAQSGENTMVSAAVFVLRRRQLIDMLERSVREQGYDLVEHILLRYLKQKDIYGYVLEGYWGKVNSVESYYRVNMDMLDPKLRQELFFQENRIYTKIEDLPPTRYNEGAQVSDSLIAGGCVINGTVEHSVLGRQVFLGRNTVVKNSIILNDVYIGDNTVIENCIVDSRDTIRANSVCRGEGEILIVQEHAERMEM